MTATPLAALVMAAGLGTRMRSSTPKHLHPLLGRRLLDWVVAAAGPLRASPFVVVCSPDTRAGLEGTLPAGVALAVQEEPRGTGDAVAAGRAALGGFEGDLLVLAGDTPLLTADVLEVLVAEHRNAGATVTALSFEPPDPGSYGRIVRDRSGRLSAIVEAADASPDELALREVNSSIYVFRVPALWDAIARLESHNAQGELYLTDAVRHLVAAGGVAGVSKAADPAAVEGVNTRVELARAAAVLRDRILERHMLAGVTVVDPATTWIEPAVEIEPDAVVHPFTVLRGRTRVAAAAEVGPHAVAVDAEIGPGALVGPFCYLRPGATLRAGAKAGTFVEVKGSVIGEGAKVPHLSYIGDAEVGAGTNIGAGAITANYRPELGEGKQRTVIGRGVHTGSHNVFVAPVEIGDGAWVAAGSTITEDVPPGSLAIARARQVTKEGYRGGERHD
ncbi:MAG: bifunctional UDP-N-acetylglucosamine diphosphorylase/glucosamine-1-phosphate N-acetyltransferase GlmU [Thermoleophilia bacterium]|nr:bifunctional UDP-N-acetylglucosamine diphosphorylase/glucosamine-1-phosphate N-acetyltransferase GlmU [Thermoleophilia bacterium]